MVREFLLKDGTFKQRFEKSEGGSLENIWRKIFPSKGKTVYKGPRAEVSNSV